MTTPQPRQDEDLFLIKRARAGDHEAFAQIVQSYQTPVYNLCYRMLGNPDEAEDAAQETFIRAYSNLHRYDIERRFLTWILSIASNHCIDRLRRRRFTWLSLDDSPILEQTPSVGVSPHRIAEQREESEQMQGWINRLSPDYRVPLLLLYWYDLSYEEIGDMLHLSIPAVKSRLHRARKQVAEMMLTSAPGRYTPSPSPTPAAASG